MKITKAQLKNIIREASNLSTKGLFAQKSSYGGYFVEDPSGEGITLGDMILHLVDAGDIAFFDTDDGQDPKNLETMLSRHEEGVQGGMDRWDSDVFTSYYNVNPVKLINRYAYNTKNRPVHWIGEDDELPSERIWREQNSSEVEYEDDGTNEFEEEYS